MKKQAILVSLAVAAGFLGASTAAIASNESVAKESSVESLAENSAVALSTNEGDLGGVLKTGLNEKNETVYVITGADGATKSRFIGSTIYDGAEELPVQLEIKYYLDETEVAPEEIAGKSGRVKILFKYVARANYQGMRVPFVAVTGVNLDGEKFSEVKVTNGRILSEGEGCTVVGYGVPGANEDLGIDFLPEEFMIEAEAKDFALGTSYTILLNDLIAEIDTTKLSEVDGVVSAVNQLADGLNELVAGSGELAGGAEKLAAGARTLATGAGELAGGAGELSEGSAQVAAGLNQLVLFNDGIIAKIDVATETVNTRVNSLLEEYGQELDPELVAEISALVSQYYNTAYDAVTNYAGQIEALANGAKQVEEGAEKLAIGAEELSGRAGELAAGAEKLAAGAKTLDGGLRIFKASGVDRLVKAANEDLAGFCLRARKMVAAAGSYRSFGEAARAESVKFIIKTVGAK